ncbi:MAG TPA: hypothetical protein VLQ48_12065 [Chloroflexia bacterium]|nr:hypothetical protein [Chloroflexia bacterium]
MSGPGLLSVRPLHTPENRSNNGRLNSVSAVELLREAKMMTTKSENLNTSNSMPANVAIPQTVLVAAPTRQEVGRAFLGALTTRDFEGLEACFDSAVQFRALTPNGVREGTGPQQTVAWLYRWFGGADLFDVQSTELSEVEDRLHISYRIRVRKDGVLCLIEQQAYCVADNGLVTVMNLLCSGFRPETAPSTAV